MTGFRRLLVALMMVIAVQPAYAVRPDEMLADPRLEARARGVGEELRCLVCRNQSIEDSEADLAHDLRVMVRRRIQEGDSDRQVIDYVRSRYGDFVLLKPPLEPGTLLLWAGPGLVLLLGASALYRFYRRPAAPEAGPLSEGELQQLAAVLREEGQP